MNVPRLLRTVRHLKFIQVVNRLTRKLPQAAVARTALAPRAGVQARVAWPAYYPCWDGDATFSFLNETHRASAPTDWNHPAWKKLWLYNLHYFDCLRQSEPIAGVGAEDCLRQSEPISGVGAESRVLAPPNLISRWIAENPVGAGNGWEPYPISLRVVNWIKYFLSDGPRDARALPRLWGQAPCFWGQAPNGVTKKTDFLVFFASLATQVRYLEKRLEYHLLANHLLANAKALVFAGTFFEGPEAERWLRKGLDLYRRELAEQVLADGVHFERSAMYHAIMLEDVLDCLNLTGRADVFALPAARMLAALDMLTGPDGSLVKFNDAAEGIALAPESLRAYAAALGMAPAPGPVPAASPGPAEGAPSDVVPVRTRTGVPYVPASGLVWLAADGWSLVAKAGAIGPDYQPGHAHADSLSFELWKDGEKILTDTGTDRYVVDDERRRQRGTAAHNVVVVDGRDSSETWGGHRVGRRARTHVEEISSTRLVAWHDGYAPLVHRRTLSLADGAVKGLDEISGRGAHAAEVRFHFMPGAEKRVTLTANYPITWETSPIALAFGRLIDAPCAVVKVTPAWENRSDLNSQIRVEWEIR